METALCDCESVTNARPLTHVLEDASDLAPIMPNMFLLDLKEVGLLNAMQCTQADSTGCQGVARRLKESLR
jgi:hypothetical protein